MATVQERLKLKRAQIDTWSIRERLSLASSVLRSGDQNWMSVSRSLRAFGNPGRPGDWFSQKSCAVQYSNLLENVESPKRKKRTGDKVDSVETPSESIVRRLTQDRIEELKKLMQEDRLKYVKLKDDIVQVKSGHADDRLDQMLSEIEEEKRQKVKKGEAHEQWLREREEKKVELERAWKPPVAPASPHHRKQYRNTMRRSSSQSEPSSEADGALDSPLSESVNVDIMGEEIVRETTTVEPKPTPTPTSPLLTSLLKSPSPAPNVQNSSILHSAISSSRGASPTITSLLNSAPGIPGSGSMVTVAPPTSVSPSLKNLVSSAINSEQPHHQLPPPNPSPAAAGAPATTVAKVITVRNNPPATVTSPMKIATPVAAVSGSSEVVTGASEVKASTPVGRVENVGTMPVSASPVESRPSQVKPKEDPVEVLIEEVVLHDESVMESEIVSSQMTDVPAGKVEEPKVEEMQAVGELKLDDQFIEVSADTPSKNPDVKKEEVIADADAGSDNPTKEDRKGQSCNTDSVESGSHDLPSEVVTEGDSTVEVVPASEAEVTSGAVAEVIELADEQESAIQTEVVDPCLQELEDMEVIILDKMQGLEEVQIVQDMKELEREVVEVVLSAKEDAKQSNEERGQESPKSDEVTSVEEGETESAVKNKNIEEIKKSLMESCAEVVGAHESEKVTMESNSGVEITKKLESNIEEKNLSFESKDALPSAIDVRSKVSEVEKIKNKDSAKEKENVQDELVSESAQGEKAKENADRVKDEVKDAKTVPTKAISKKETRESTKKDVSKESARKDLSLKESLRKDAISVDSKKEHREQSEEEVKSKVKEVMKKETNKESVKEPVKEEVRKEAPSKKDDVAKQGSSSKDEKKEALKDKKEQNQRKEQKDALPKETVSRNREELKDTARKELPTGEGRKKFGREVVKKEQPDKQAVKDASRESSKRDILKKELPPKEVVKESQIKEGKKEPNFKETNKKDATPESDSNKSNPPKEVPKKDLLVKDVAEETPGKKEVSRRDSKDERKEMVRRGGSREERKESEQEDLRKRSHLKEMSRGMTRKSDAEKKNPDVSKVKGKVGRPRKDSSNVAQTVSKDTKENKREQGAGDAKLKTDEAKTKEVDISAKDTKQTSGSVNGKTSKTEGENKINADTGENTKESTKGSEETKSADVQELLDERVGRRTPLRAETPSTEDDKTNDAEPPKTVGRKRLTTFNMLDSVPNSPASASTTDEEREYRAWKKSIMLLYVRLATHKYASLFLRPITDEQAPGYSKVVHRPIDLLTIKKNIETGVVRSTVEFQRDVMLMFQNSIMYNKSNHFVHKMARQMQQEGMQHIQDFLSTQILLQVSGEGVPIRRETRTTEANKQRDMLGNPTASSSQEEGDNSLIIHKRKKNIGEGDRSLKKKKVDD